MVKIILCLGIVTSSLTGCGSKQKKEMHSYIEQKYNIPFEIEEFHGKSKIFPDISGSSKLLVHPKDRPTLPVMVYANSNTDKPFTDDYVMNKLSDDFSNKYKGFIENYDALERKVELMFLGTVFPNKAEELSMTADELNKNSDYDLKLYTFVIVKVSPGFDAYSDKNFVLALYQYIESITNRDFVLVINYVASESFELAKTILRVSKATNVSFSLLDEDLIAGVVFKKNQGLQAIIDVYNNRGK